MIFIETRLLILVGGVPEMAMNQAPYMLMMMQVVAIGCVAAGNTMARTGKPASGFALSTLGMMMLVGVYWATPSM